MFPEPGPLGKSDMALIGCPGMSQTVQISTGTAPVYKIIPIGDYLYAVNQTHCTKVQYTDSWGAQSAVALNSSLSAIPTAAWNKSYILLDNADRINLSTMTATATTFGWSGSDAQCVAYMDGYFIAVQTNSHAFYISGLNDITSWGSLDYASAETESDYLLRVFPFRKELWMFGEYTTEVWYNSGDPEFPFASNPSAFSPIGIINKRCVASVGESLMFVGRNQRGEGEVYIMDGYNPRKVSTSVIDYHIQSYKSDFDNANCWSFRMEGHDFFVIDFPAYGTWVFDLATEEWHEWLEWDSTAESYGAIPIREYCYYENMHLVTSRSDNTTNAIGELSLDTDTHFGSNIKKLKRSPILADDTGRKLVSHNMFELDAHLEDAGTISMRYSDDGGNNWSTAKDKTLTAADYDARIKWYRLGQSRNRIYELYTTSQMKTIWMDAFIEAEVGEF